MHPTLDLTGKLEYQVNYVKEGAWHCLGGTHKPMRFGKKIDAEHSVQAIRQMNDIGDVLLVQVETTFYSDLETQSIHKQIVYTGVR